MNADTGYAVGDYGTIIKTTDGGETWMTLSSGTTYPLWSVWFTDENKGVVAGNEGGPIITPGFILETFDGGVTWTELPSASAPGLRSVSFLMQRPVMCWVVPLIPDTFLKPPMAA